MAEYPGFTPEQAWALDMVAARAARKVLAERDAQPCTAACPRVEEVRDSVYGNGSPGLKTRVERLEGQVESLLWWNRATIGVALTASGALIVQFVVSVMR